MKELKEEWRDIEGYEGLYQVSTLGQVRRINNGKQVRILKPVIYKSGYQYVTLSKEGVRINKRLNRLVALTFFTNEAGYPVVNHLNENKLDNRLDNLSLTTHKMNNVWGTHRLISARKVKTHDNVFPSIRDAAKYLQMSEKTLSNYLRGRNRMPQKLIDLGISFA